MAVKLRRKSVIVGPGACGKTCLLIVFHKGEFPESMTQRGINYDTSENFRDIAMQYYVPTTFENYVANVEFDNKRVKLALWNTAGQEDHHYQTDTLDNVVEKQVPEVIHFCSQPRVPYVLVGCKLDLRRQRPTVEARRRIGQRPITTKQGREVALRVGARMYLEYSSHTGEGVLAIFQNATRTALLEHKRNSGVGVDSVRGCGATARRVYISLPSSGGFD